MEYPVVIQRLADEDGGGYLAFFPDLIGCMGDGETPEEALADARSAFDEWMDAAEARGLSVPAPHSANAIAAREREALLTAIRDARNHHEALDALLDELERQLVDIEEQIAHVDSWARFGTITGHVVVTERRLLG